MAETTTIEWAHATFNPWTGCTKVSPACDHCYAESWAKRSGTVEWGPGKPRRRTRPQNWAEPLKWNAKAKAEGKRWRVFCASLADVFDTEVPDEWRADLMALIQATPDLDWLLLTKRPKVMAEWFVRHPVPENVWAGTTVESQKMAELRIPELLKVDARIHFLSVEPMLGPIDLWKVPGAIRCCGTNTCATVAQPHELCEVYTDLGWIIAGGESGPGARPLHPDWARELRDVCFALGVPFLWKQWGEWTESRQVGGSGWAFTRERDGRRFGRLTRGEFGTDGYAFDGRDFETRFPFPTAPDPGPCMVRVGKKHAGRLLDGVQHDGVPA